MDKEWAPSFWGQRLTGSPEWRLRLDGEELSLGMNGRVYRVPLKDETAVRIRLGSFWTDITLFPGQPREVKADGLPNSQGAALTQALNVALIEKRIHEAVAFLQRTHLAIDQWLAHKAAQEKAAVERRWWFTHEMQAAVEAACPSVDVKKVSVQLRVPGVRSRMGPQARALESSLSAFTADHRATWASLNEAHTKRELALLKELFDRVESQPLTNEQARAVICFDNRVQVVASAGSGKTSTMVAKAAYAIHREIVPSEKIVLLAFNKKAASELKERAAKSFERLGMDGIALEASTFHALGLRIIGRATGETPDIPEWATDAVGGFRKLAELVDDLKDRSATFRAQWDMFRFVYGRDISTQGSPSSADTGDERGKRRLRTAKGDIVKSGEEAIIANWLFYNGVEYRYEERYKHKTADEQHRQYRPDFYYPSIDLYHEHFALDAQGKPPSDFENYLDGVHWKRRLHKEMGTLLIETTSHGLSNLNDLQRLEAELASRRIELDPNPDREIPSNGQRPMEASELIGLVRTFISHTKSNGLTIPALRKRLDAMPGNAFKNRHGMFLDIVAPIMHAWDAALAAEGGIDFEDMLNLAAEHLESGRYEAPYELVMADEFQDASRARARLCRALVQRPGRFLFAVGDDWQSINRFAGADVSVMTGFRKWFGHGQILKLEQTFRCPQALCDVSSQFVSKNPAQITKRVHSVTPAHGPVLQGFQVDSKDKLADAIDQFVMALARDVQSGKIQPGRSGRVSVFILGRYNADRQYVPGRKFRFEQWVDISFLTIHRSKGSEADYVILPEMLSVLRGRSFPNTRADDPVLALAMPDGDDYPMGEERRLFYVALTRARRSVAMFTARGQNSVFIRELVDDGALVITDTGGRSLIEEACPTCKQGVLILRTDPYGEFRSCSNYPECVYKPGSSASALSLPSPGGKPASPVPDSRPSAQRRAKQIQAASALTPPQQPESAPRVSISSVLKGIGEGLDRFNRGVLQVSEVMRATSSLERNISAERIAIKVALSTAESNVAREDRLKDPVLREAYEKALRRITADKQMEASEADDSHYPVPSFERSSTHPDPDTEAAIRRKVDALRADREAFLSVIRAKLNRDTQLREFFLKALREQRSERYLPGLDPTSSWEQRASETPPG